MLFEIELEEMLVFEDAVSEWLLLLAVVVAAEAAAAALLLVLIPRTITINRLSLINRSFNLGGMVDSKFAEFNILRK